MRRFEPSTARSVLRACAIPDDVDFHALSWNQVDHLISWADSYNYRKPRNANGSRARYFHAYLVRRATKQEHK